MFPTINNPSAGSFLVSRSKVLLQNQIDTLHVKLSNILYHHHIMNNYSFSVGNDFITDFHVINYLKFRYRGNFEFVADKLYKIYKTSNRNLLHVHFGFPEGYIGYILKRKYNIPYILTVHGSDIHTILLKSIHYRNMTLRGLNHAEHVIFVSENLFKTAKSLGFKNKYYSVIPGGVDTKTFHPNKRKKNRYITIGFIGHLERVKRANLIPEIFYNINKSYKNSRFLIVGDGSLKNDIEHKLNLMNIRKITQITGAVPYAQIPDIFHKINFLILPSKNEGFPSVVLESLSSGVPVIASKAGGIPEIINNGINGVLVARGNDFPKQFSQKVLSAIEKQWDADRIRDTILKYDWRNVVNQEIDIYEKVLNL